MRELAARGIAARFDARTGWLADFAVDDGGRSIAPLHRAPWVSPEGDATEAMPPGAAPHMERLGGDFFCAPFGGREDGSPLHGWPANAAWRMREGVRESGPDALHAVLGRKVRGAELTKELTLRDGHPFVYQRHAFEGGAGSLAVANHACVSVPDGALISTSPKARWETPPDPLETDPARGRSLLAYPARGRGAAFPTADGGTVDLTTYPWGPRHEDFVAGIEAPGRAFGWTAVVRPASRDAYLSLRDPRALPMTMLWHSNGGRDYAPWNGRHTGCLGVEEGAAGHLLTTADDAPRPGALVLRPDGTAEVRHAIGALAWPTGERVARVTLAGDEVVVTGAAGAERRLPFDAGFLGGGR